MAHGLELYLRRGDTSLPCDKDGTAFVGLSNTDDPAIRNLTTLTIVSGFAQFELKGIDPQSVQELGRALTHWAADKIAEGE